MVERKLITPKGYQRLQDELQRLWHEERPKLVHEVSDAAALGDRSENAEYIYGKKRLREIDRRIRELSNLIDRLDVVDPKTQTSDRVQFGATVEVADEDGNKRTYMIVGEDEVEAKTGHISMQSPVGQSLLNKSRGDSCLVKRPAGEIELTILNISY